MFADLAISALENDAGPALGMFEVFGRTWPSTIGGRHFGPYNAAKCDCGRAGRAYSALPDPLAGFKGADSRREGEGKEGEKKGNEGEG